MAAVLTKIEKDLRSIHAKLFDSDSEITAKVLRDRYWDQEDSSPPLLDYFDQFIAEISNLPEEFTLATCKKYKTIRTYTTSYLRSKSRSHITIANVRSEHIHEFEYHLRTIAGLNVNTTTKYLKQLKAIFNRAIRIRAHWQQLHARVQIQIRTHTAYFLDA